MRLKRLTLQGYKTFATKTQFEFDEGITAIVGPNGSGKSNIADAMRWVLGEQSYSTLRGKKTADMIFAGGQQRAPAGMAQAVLTLDNSSGWLPIEYSEIEIGRRAFRSGENEYLLNGQRVRLRDVSELLASSGLAERTYTIIGQGLIDQALSLRADERRALFEEAAGIAHYKHQRATTLRRLEETQHNLERIHDILAELKPRLNYLKRQSNRAQNYEQVAADLRHQLRIFYGYQWRQTRLEARLARLASEEAEKAWQTSRLRQSELRASLTELREKINAVRGELKQRQSKREELRQQQEEVRRRLAVAQERREQFVRQLREIGDEIPDVEQQRALTEAHVVEAANQVEVAQKLLDKREVQRAEFRESSGTLRQEIEKREKAIARLEAQQQSYADEISELRGKSRQLAAQRTELQESAVTDPQLQESNDQVKSVETEVLNLEAAVSALQLDRAAGMERVSEAEGRVKQLAAQIQALEETIADQQKALAETRVKQEILGRQVTGQVNVPDGLAVVGRLVELISVPAELERALEAALTTKLDAWVLKEPADVWRLAAANTDAFLQAVSLVGQGEPRTRPQPSSDEVIGWADEMITVDASLRPLVERLLGNVLIVNSREAAFELAKKLPSGLLTVTLEGFVAEAAGLITQRPQQENGQGILSREQELREIAGQFREQTEKISDLQERKRQLTISRDVAAEELRETRDGLHLIEADIGVKQEKLSQEKRRLDRAEQAHSFLTSQRAEQENSLERLAADIKETEARVQIHRQRLLENEENLRAAQEQLERLPVAESAAEEEQLRQQTESARTILAGRQAVLDSRRATLNQIDDRLSRLQERGQQLQSQLEGLALAQTRAQLGKLENEVAEAEATLRPLQERLAGLQERFDAGESALAESQRTGHDLETRYSESRIELTRAENRIESLQERIRADLGLVALDYDEDETSQVPLPISEVVERLPEVDELPRDIEESIQTYRGQLNRMGAVNPEAPAEYQETQERYDFLEKQIEDLTRTERKLRQVIKELDELTSKAFAETVERVNDVFGDVFERLFGGGTAHLMLTDPDDLTISGVDIIARLPRRREQGLALLSGGERSLTASALVFALLKVAPTPFCVLDEVDAMLDEANVNRFRELLRELSEQTQFVVITHNRGTVQVARTIYGISMGTDGASQVISIRPEEYLSSTSRGS
ncbi:MAG: chromosome segregation protein SMC [Candidatus Promineifilaceae bacterium]|nr:chromosome segregation protein SMC [Candidatus Promineifilaceae bacterium]